MIANVNTRRRYSALCWRLPGDEFMTRRKTAAKQEKGSFRHVPHSKKAVSEPNAKHLRLKRSRFPAKLLFICFKQRGTSMAERLFRLLNIVDSWLFPEKDHLLTAAIPPGRRRAGRPVPQTAHGALSPDSAAFSNHPPRQHHSAFALLCRPAPQIDFDAQVEEAFARRRFRWPAMSALPLGVYDALVPVPTTRRRLRQRASSGPANG